MSPKDENFGLLVQTQLLHAHCDAQQVVEFGDADNPNAYDPNGRIFEGQSPQQKLEGTRSLIERPRIVDVMDECQSAAKFDP